MAGVDRCGGRLVLCAWVLSGLGAVSCRGLHGSGGDSGAADASSDAGEGGAGSSALEAGPSDDAIPPTSSDELTVRARHLLEAIAQDNADLATDILFPRDGWMATRDSADPGKVWEKRVAGPFRRAVHSLSRRHKDLDRAQFVSIELGHAMVQVTPRRHGWQKPLWGVTGSRLSFVADGKTRTFDHPRADRVARRLVRNEAIGARRFSPIPSRCRRRGSSPYRSTAPRPVTGIARSRRKSPGSYQALLA